MPNGRQWNIPSLIHSLRSHQPRQSYMVFDSRKEAHHLALDAANPSLQALRKVPTLKFGIASRSRIGESLTVIAGFVPGTAANIVCNGASPRQIFGDRTCSVICQSRCDDCLPFKTENDLVLRIGRTNPCGPSVSTRCRPSTRPHRTLSSGKA